MNEVDKRSEEVKRVSFQAGACRRGSGQVCRALLVSAASSSLGPCDGCAVWELRTPGGPWREREAEAGDMLSGAQLPVLLS